MIPASRVVPKAEMADPMVFWSFMVRIRQPEIIRRPLTSKNYSQIPQRRNEKWIALSAPGLTHRFAHNQEMED
jgi:hypothetical protein